jgi:hypothetical protein
VKRFHGLLGQVALAALLLAPLGAGAQPAMGGGAPMGGAGSAGLPPFLAKMKRHDVSVHVVRRNAQGQTTPAPADLPVSILITAGGSKVRSYEGKTGADGVAAFTGIPTNPEVQADIGYVVSVDIDGVRFPFTTSTIPTDGGFVELAVPEVANNPGDLTLAHSHIELFPDEENLVVRHTMQVANRSDKAIDLSLQPGGGLRLPLPAGGKHPELHEEISKDLVEVRGTDLYYKGVILPGGQPTEITVVYTIAYSDDVFEWTHAVPVRTVGALVVAPTGRQEGQRVDLPLGLVTRGEQGTVQTRDVGEGKRFQVLRMSGLDLAPGQPMRFAITGLPVEGRYKLGAMVVALLLVFAVVLLGFRGSSAGDTERLSRAHLENERDRLHKALDRMRKAVEKGRLSHARFEREQEAITARLVSLYRALDRLEKT